MIKLIFNFSHPLGSTTGPTEMQILEKLGQTTVAIVTIPLPLPLDPEKSLVWQVEEVCWSALDDYGQPDAIIPPPDPTAAILIDRFFSVTETDIPCVTFQALIRLDGGLVEIITEGEVTL